MLLAADNTRFKLFTFPWTIRKMFDRSFPCDASEEIHKLIYSVSAKTILQYNQLFVVYIIIFSMSNPKQLLVPKNIY